MQAAVGKSNECGFHFPRTGARHFQPLCAGNGAVGIIVDDQVPTAIEILVGGDPIQ
jgi:hypothetical protein